MSSLKHKQLKIVIVSIGLVFLNKRILSHKDIDIPVFITLIQCLVAVLCSFLVQYISKRTTHTICVYKWNWLTHVQLLNVTLLFIAMILFNNLTLKMIPVSFYNIVRALSTVFNLIFTRLILKRSVSLPAVICTFIVIIGFLCGMGELGEGMLSLVPALVGTLASMFVSLFAIFTKSSLEYVNQNPWMFQTFNNINALFIIFPLLPITGELSLVINQIHYIFSPEIFFSLLISGVLGFLIGICTTLQIQYTSALTHNISGTAKAYFVGSGMYSYVCNKEMTAAHTKLLKSNDNSM
ncbi:LOW QUALITY PROTEIN: hypothetical protein MXB_5230 [Myxobolus squamalis]|nr:LOW QUALITY PROTEIN: hypothetical protein MXB_5230 [Myxobolus squamalis]